jgi:hypothetical protein
MSDSSNTGIIGSLVALGTPIAVLAGYVVRLAIRVAHALVDLYGDDSHTGLLARAEDHEARLAAVEKRHAEHDAYERGRAAADQSGARAPP